MKRNSFYTKKALHCFRIISLICAILLVSVEVWSFFQGALREIRLGTNIDFYDIFNHCLNFLSILFFVFVFFLPQKFGLTSIIAFIYATSIIPFEQENYMGIMMFFLGTVILFARGLMKNYRNQKLILLSIFLSFLMLSQIRFGISLFLSSLVSNIGCILVLAVVVFFIRAYSSNNLMYEDKKLNLACYPKLTERDCEMLKSIQQGEKYSIIAKQVCLSHGSLKNRLHEVFTILETGDKQGFLSYYSDWEICYDPESVESVEEELASVN